MKLFLGFNFLLFIVFERYWTQAFANNGVLAIFFQVLASVNLAEEQKIPKLTAESTWDFEM